MDVIQEQLDEAQVAVRGVHMDLRTLRRQIDDSAQTAAEAAANPFCIELQATIRSQQERAAELLETVTGHLQSSFASLGDQTKSAASAIRAREKELTAMKLRMQRYFDTHNKSQDDQQTHYEGLLRVEQMKVEGLQQGAAALWAANSARDLKRHLLHIWMKRAIIASLMRHAHMCEETARGETLDAEVETRARTDLRVRVFHVWERRTQRRRLRRVQAEAQENARQADFFRAQAQQAQGDLSARLQERQSAALVAVAETRGRECDTLESDCEALRIALAETATEFADRTRTYVQQQDETERFFAQKEAALAQALHAAQQAAEECRLDTLRLSREGSRLLLGYSAHSCAMCEAVAQCYSRKEAALVEAIGTLVTRSSRRLREVEVEANQLTRDVALLSPLSAKTVRLEAQLSVAQEAAQRAGKEVRTLKGYRDVAGLLTERVMTDDAKALRLTCLHRWALWTAMRRLGQYQEAHSTLSARLRDQEAEFLTRQQTSAREHASAVSQLEEDLHAARAETRSVSDLFVAENRQCEQLRGDLLSSEMTSLVACEAKGRLEIELTEARHRSAIMQRNAGALRMWALASRAEASELVSVCEEWQTHCDALEARAREQRHGIAQRVSAALGQEHTVCRARKAFIVWKDAVILRRASNIVVSRVEALQREMDALAASTEAAHAAHAEKERQLRESAQAVESALTEAVEEGEDLRGELRKQKEVLSRTRAEHAVVLKGLHLQMGSDIAALEALQRKRLESVGVALVPLCASAALSKWRAWTVQRTCARRVRQQAVLVTKEQRWCRGQDALAEQLRIAKEDLYTQCVVEVLTQEQHSLSRLLRKQMQLQELVDTVASAGEAEVHRLQQAAAAEREHAQLLQRKLSAAVQAQAEESDAARAEREWRAMVHWLLLGHLEAAATLFSDSALALAAERAAQFGAMQKELREAEQRNTTLDGMSCVQSADDTAQLLSTIVVSDEDDDIGAAGVTEEQGMRRDNGQLLALSGLVAQLREELIAADDKRVSILLNAWDERLRSTSSELPALQGTFLPPPATLLSTQLDALATQYECVLHAFLQEIVERRAEFGASTRMLKDAEDFAADLLDTYTHTLRSLPSLPSPPAAASTPAVSVSSPQPPSSPSVSPAEGRALQMRVRQLEQMLVDAKLQVAVQKERAENATPTRSGSQTPPLVPLSSPRHKPQVDEDNRAEALSMARDTIGELGLAVSAGDLTELLVSHPGTMPVLLQSVRHLLIQVKLRAAESHKEDSESLAQAQARAEAERTARYEARTASLMATMERNNSAHAREVAGLIQQLQETEAGAERELQSQLERHAEEREGFLRSLEEVKAAARAETQRLHEENGQLMKPIRTNLQECAVNHTRTLFSVYDSYMTEKMDRLVYAISTTWMVRNALCVAEAQCALEEAETDCMQLRERAAALESELTSLREKPALPSPSSSEAMDLEVAPALDSTALVNAETNTDTAAPVIDTPVINPLRETCEAAPHTPSPAPAQEPVTLLAPVDAVTPVRARSRSVDTLELSQSMLRYSQMLNKHSERNTERLDFVDALSAEVEDLMARGAQLQRLAIESGHTPLSHR